MSSKKNPGKFDCYKAAEPEEEMFVLLGRDDFGGAMVRLWIALRLHNFDEAKQYLKELIETAEARGRSTNLVKMGEAQECADRMDAWMVVLDQRSHRATTERLTHATRNIVKDGLAFLKSQAKKPTKKAAKKRKSKKKA